MKKTTWITFIAVLCMLGCGRQGELIVEKPNSQFRNSRTLEIDKVIVNDTATILYMDAFYRPNQWIRIDSETYLRAAGKKYPVKGSEGIVLDAEHYIPATGEDSFVLWFPPLARGVKSFDFIESDCDDCFKFWGIDLTGNLAYKSILPKELQSFETPGANDELSPPRLEVGNTRVDLYFYGIPEGFTIDDPKIGARNFLKGTRDEWTGEEAETGHYVFEQPLYGTSTAQLQFNGSLIGFILSPGETAEIHIDLPSSGASQSRYSTLPESPYIAFRGVYATVNNEMNLPGKMLEHSIWDPGYDPATWKLDDDAYLRKLEAICRELEEKIDAMDISRELKTVYRQDIKSQAAFGVSRKWDIMRNSEWTERQTDDLETAAREKPLRPEDYRFLQQYDLNNPYWLFSEVVTVARPLIDGVPSEETIDLITGQESGLLQDLFKAKDAIAEAETEGGATEEQLARLNTVSNIFFTESYETMLRTAYENRQRAMEQGGFTIAEVPAVTDDRVIEAILDRYKGQPVFIDFWATWCGPCLRAMELMKPLKPDMAANGVVSLYISNPSSPQAKWISMLPDIGGIHYYLTQEQWGAVSKKYDIQFIPQYMIFDRSGKLSHQITGIPDMDKLRTELEKVW